MVLAGVELWTGSADAAHKRLSELRPVVVSRGWGCVGSMTIRLWSYDIEALIALARLREADQVLSDLFERVGGAENPNAVAIAHRCHGLLLTARGEISAAIDALDAAISEHSYRPLPFEIGRTLLEKGRLERRAKRKTAAKRTLEQSLEILEHLGTAMWINQAKDELSRIGLRRQSLTEGLTEAQSRVLELVAAGMSNREIAAALYMSQRSVESHLTKIYREYGVRSRTQLVKTLATGASLTREPERVGGQYA